MSATPEPIFYQRARFTTKLPADRRYTPDHFWLREVQPGLWHVGFTKFATRLLGTIVEYDFELQPGDAVKPGQIVGWVEAFKAVADLHAPAAGIFAGGNPDLIDNPNLIDQDPYAAWLYAIRGTPDPTATDVHGYIAILDQTIDDRRHPHRPD